MKQSLLQKPAREHPRFVKDENAFLDLGDISATLSGVIKVIVVLVIIGATIGLLFTAIADIVGVFTSDSTTTNSATADLLLPVLGLLVALAGVFMIVRLVFRAAN